MFEAVGAALVLAIMVAGLAQALSARASQITSLQQYAAAEGLAHQLMDEIVAKPLANPTSGSTTPAAAASTNPRATFVAVGDYNLYSDKSTDLSTLSGATLDATGPQSFTRSVTVSLGATPSVDTLSPTTDFGLVTVTVTTPAGETVKLQRVVTNYTFTR
jgi:hypothetical protein